jgi:hypothetical protein
VCSVSGKWVWNTGMGHEMLFCNVGISAGGPVCSVWHIHVFGNTVSLCMMKYIYLVLENTSCYC